VRNGEVICNNSLPFPYDQPLTLTGTTETNNVTILNSEVTLLMDNLSITNSAPFVIDHSSTDIRFTGVVELFATSPFRAGLECGSLSNISLQLIDDGDLSVTGGSLSAGIGTGAFGSCNSLDFINGTYNIVGGTGIGSGFSNGTMNSKVNWIKIENGDFLVNGSNHGAGIGSGY
jgi:hypothetical protein